MITNVLWLRIGWKSCGAKSVKQTCDDFSTGNCNVDYFLYVLAD